MDSTLDAFGDCLVNLLNDKHCSAKELAHALNVDQSLIYRWMRGERTPGLASGYVARIATLLNLTSGEQVALEASQLTSLRVPRPPKVPKRPTRGDVQGLLNLKPAFDALPPELPHSSGVERAQPRVGSSGAIQGRTAAILAALELIDNAPEPADSSDRAASTILITSLEWGHVNTSAVLEYAQEWHAIARRAMARGWHFCHLIRLDKDARRSLAMARMVLDLMGSGRYTALYLYTNELLLPACELGLIPGHAAIQFFATQTLSSVDAATITKDCQQIAVLQAYFQQVAGKAKPLLQTFSPEEWVVPEQLRAEAEEQYGTRVIVKDGLSRITEPAWWSCPASPRALRPGFSGEALSTLVDTQKRRLAAFEAHVGLHLYRDICPMRSVVRLVQEGQYLHNDAAAHVVAPAEERIDQLANVIALLRKYDNYELALVDESQESEIPVLPGRFWEVIGDMRVFTELVHDLHGRTMHTGILIAEPSIVSAFQQYFDTLWSRIAPRNKDKGFVIWWFERQLESLQESLH